MRKSIVNKNASVSKISNVSIFFLGIPDVTNYLTSCPFFMVINLINYILAAPPPPVVGIFLVVWTYHWDTMYSTYLSYPYSIKIYSFLVEYILIQFQFFSSLLYWVLYRQQIVKNCVGVITFTWRKQLVDYVHSKVSRFVFIIII